MIWMKIKQLNMVGSWRVAIFFFFAQITIHRICCCVLREGWNRKRDKEGRTMSKRQRERVKIEHMHLQTRISTKNRMNQQSSKAKKERPYESFQPIRLSGQKLRISTESKRFTPLVGANIPLHRKKEMIFSQINQLFNRMIIIFGRTAQCFGCVCFIYRSYREFPQRKYEHIACSVE